MKNIGVKIKEAMRKQGVTRAELAEKADLSIDTITNIIYGKSKKYEHVTKIGEILDIQNIDALILNSYDTIYDSPKLDFSKYNQIVSQLDKIAHQRGIEVPKKLFDIIIETAYAFSIKHKPSNQVLSAYIAGMVDFGMAVQALTN
jgi:transcriptional regulator with XRE-family HTH domain